MADPTRVRDDFDRIAGLSRDLPEGPTDYEGYLLGRLPPRCERALDVGCGTGGFARRLAERAAHVMALDLSPGMIELARARSAAFPNIDYVVGDLATWTAPDTFDCVTTQNTLHHLPFEAGLARLSALVRPGGLLLVVNLFRIAGPVNWVAGALAFALRAARRRRPATLPPPEVLAAWREHGEHDELLSIGEVRRRATRCLPGARVRRHLYFRYSLSWRRPARPA